MPQTSLIFMAGHTIILFTTVLGSLPSSGVLIAEEAGSPLVALVHESLGVIPGNRRWDWWQARTAHVPGSKPMWITTMSETGKTTSHDFHDIFQSVSHDQGKTWSAAQMVPSLQRRAEEDGYQVAPGDLTHQHNSALQLRLAE